MQEVQFSKIANRAEQIPPVPSLSAPATSGKKYQILAKRGFLTAKNTSTDLVLLVYSEQFQLGVLLNLPAACVLDHSRTDVFSQSAISMILNEFEALGVDRKQLTTFVIGGAETESASGVSQFAVQKMLTSFGLPAGTCDLGGKQIRSIWMDVESGRTIVRSQPWNGSPANAASLPVAS